MSILLTTYCTPVSAFFFLFLFSWTGLYVDFPFLCTFLRVFRGEIKSFSSLWFRWDPFHAFPDLLTCDVTAMYTLLLRVPQFSRIVQWGRVHESSYFCIHNFFLPDRDFAHRHPVSILENNKSATNPITCGEGNFWIRIVVLIKPFVWRRSRCRCRRGLPRSLLFLRWFYKAAFTRQT